MRSLLALALLLAAPTANSLGVAGTGEAGAWELLVEAPGEFLLLPLNASSVTAAIAGALPRTDVPAEGVWVDLAPGVESVLLTATAQEPGAALLLLPADPAEAGVAVPAGVDAREGEARRILLPHAPIVAVLLVAAFLLGSNLYVNNIRK